MKSITQLAQILAMGVATLVPMAASAESTTLFWRDAEVSLDDAAHQTALLWESARSNQTQVITAKVIVRNTTNVARTVECKLTNTSSVDFADATLAPGQMTTLAATIANGPPGAATQFFCYILGARSGVGAQWAKMTIRYGAPTVTSVQRP